MPRLSSRWSFGRTARFSSGERRERDHGGVANVCDEEILVQKADAIGDVCLTRVLTALGDAHGIDIDADAARPELLGRGDDDAPVAAPEIVTPRRRRSPWRAATWHAPLPSAWARSARREDAEPEGRRSLLCAAVVRDPGRGDDGEKNRTTSSGCSECPDQLSMASHDVPFFPGCDAEDRVERRDRHCG